jgi:dTMP kinase
MDDRRGVPLIADLVDAFRGDIGVVNLYEKKGLFIAFEGGEGSGKSTQTQALKSWLEAQGRTVVLSREPGGTEIGQKIRKLLLDPATGEVSPRAEALLYAADRAEHVDTVIRPAIDRGAVVITDRYIDSSIAYQGGGRVLPSEDVMRLSRWATSGLLPDMTVVLDIDPRLGLARCKDHDRLEQEPMEFHDRVRRTFVQLARSEPERYLVIDANQSSEEISRIIQNRFAELLVDPKASK